jgi:transcriptional regulator of acetoin/glycerol metabolism
LRDLEREMMVAALRETRGNVSEAARRLGIGRATFYRRAQRHGLTRDDGFLG